MRKPKPKEKSLVYKEKNENLYEKEKGDFQKRIEMKGIFTKAFFVLIENETKVYLEIYYLIKIGLLNRKNFP